MNKKTKIIIEKMKHNIIQNRSCWNCNPAHNHLKKFECLIFCIWCGHVYYKGKCVDKILIENDKALKEYDV